MAVPVYLRTVTNTCTKLLFAIGNISSICLYFVYLIIFILDFLDGGYCNPFHSFEELELELEKRTSIFGCDYCKAENTIVGTKRP